MSLVSRWRFYPDFMSFVMALMAPCRFLMRQVELQSYDAWHGKSSCLFSKQPITLQTPFISDSLGSFNVIYVKLQHFVNETI